MTVRPLLAVLGALQVVNAVVMLAAPENWYAAVPGVAMTGPFNAHFVRDIGFAYLASGAGLTLGARNGRGAAVLASAGAVWPALHGLFHVYGWVEHGFSADLTAAAAEVFGVVIPGTLGVVLAWLRMKGEAKC